MNEKWKPNDELYNISFKYADLKGKCKANESKYNENKLKIEDLEREMEEFKNDTNKISDIIYVKTSLEHHKRENFILQQDIESLNKVKNANPEIVDSYNIYLDQAKQFLIDKNIYDVISHTDILSSINIIMFYSFKVSAFFRELNLIKEKERINEIYNLYMSDYNHKKLFEMSKATNSKINKTLIDYIRIIKSCHEYFNVKNICDKKLKKIYNYHNGNWFSYLFNL